MTKRKYAPQQAAYIAAVARCAAIQTEVKRSMAQHQCLLDADAGIETFVNLECACEDDHGWIEARETERQAEDDLMAWCRQRVMTDPQTARLFVALAPDLEHVFVTYKRSPRIRERMLAAALALAPEPT